MIHHPMQLHTCILMANQQQQQAARMSYTSCAISPIRHMHIPAEASCVCPCCHLLPNLQEAQPLLGQHQQQAAATAAAQMPATPVQGSSQDSSGLPGLPLILPKSLIPSSVANATHECLWGSVLMAAINFTAARTQPGCCGDTEMPMHCLHYCLCIVPQCTCIVTPRVLTRHPPPSSSTPYCLVVDSAPCISLDFCAATSALLCLDSPSEA